MPIWPLFVTGLAGFAVILDTTILFVALPDISGSFADAATEQLSWVPNGYAIMFTALLVPLGKLAERLGRRRLFLLGSAGLILASLLCAVAPDPWTPIAARVLQAAAEAALVPPLRGLREATGIPRATPTAGLDNLVERGVLDRHEDQDRPTRHEGHLADLGRASRPIVISMMRWATSGCATTNPRPRSSTSTRVRPSTRSRSIAAPAERSTTCVPSPSVRSRRSRPRTPRRARCAHRLTTSARVVSDRSGDAAFGAPWAQRSGPPASAHERA